MKKHECLELYVILNNACEANLLQHHFDGIKTNIDSIKKIYDDIAPFLKILHDNKIVHFDIKPENILYCQGKYKLIDYGLMQKDIKFLKGRYSIGTPSYILPYLESIANMNNSEANIYYSTLHNNRKLYDMSLNIFTFENIKYFNYRMNPYNDVYLGIKCDEFALASTLNEMLYKRLHFTFDKKKLDIDLNRIINGLISKDRFII